MSRGREGRFPGPQGSGTLAEGAARMPREVRADRDGVLRFSDDGQEAAFFGVNYVAPFAYTYRALGYVGASPEKTIQDDLLHLERMGANALRVHLWDAEISDLRGNLIDNDHLRLLDFLIDRCRQRGLHVLLTPIHWGNNGYPEADRRTEGFSFYYPKREMGANPAAVEAQGRYLGQLARHVNRYTGQAYADDPAIVGFELVNEPWSPPIERLPGYVEALAKAIRETGCRKPLFYNASQGGWAGQSRVLQESSVEGCTFGWYPSGLVSGRELAANFLPAIDRYPMMSEPAFDRKTKLVYEFDGADVGGAYLYPAFARTFRTHGAQWATQFAYCPLPLAGENTPYPTHFLNLVYAPRKALSFRIAAQVFRALPRGRDFGRYPANVRFGPARVSYERDLSEWVDERNFLYSNDTATLPPAPAALERVIGCGSSPLVAYEGAGGYFLERRRPGLWRLELYPDALRVKDPFGVPRLDREAVRLLWRAWPLRLRLPDLGDDFRIEAIDAGHRFRGRARAGGFVVRPGVYLLSRRGLTPRPAERAPVEFVAPPATEEPPAAVHRPPVEAVAGRPLTLAITLAAAVLPERGELHLRCGSEGALQVLPLRRQRGYRYTATVPAALLRPGPLEYFVRLGDGTGRWRDFPADRSGTSAPVPLFSAKAGEALRLAAAESRVVPVDPAAGAAGAALLVRTRATGGSGELTVHLEGRDGQTVTGAATLGSSWRTHRIPLSALRPARGWVLLRRPAPRDLAGLRLAAGPDCGVEVEWIGYGPLQEVWTTTVRAARSAPVLFEAGRDFSELLMVGAGGPERRVRLVAEGDAAALAVEAVRFERSSDLALRILLDARWRERRPEWQGCEAVRIRARATQPGTRRLELALIARDGTAWAAEVELTASWSERTVPLSALARRAVVRVPIVYPTSLGETPLPPESAGRALPLPELEAIQFTLGPRRFAEQAEGPQGCEIERVTLVRPRRR